MRAARTAMTSATPSLAGFDRCFASPAHRQLRAKPMGRERSKPMDPDLHYLPGSMSFFREFRGQDMRVDDTGGDHILLIVDEQYAFRFPRAGMHSLDLELKTLKHLQARTTLRTPVYELCRSRRSVCRLPADRRVSAYPRALSLTLPAIGSQHVRHRRCSVLPEPYFMPWSHQLRRHCRIGPGHGALRNMPTGLLSGFRSSEHNIPRWLPRSPFLSKSTAWSHVYRHWLWSMAISWPTTSL